MNSNQGYDQELIHYLDGYKIIRDSHFPTDTWEVLADRFTARHQRFGKVVMNRPRTPEGWRAKDHLIHFKSQAKIWGQLRHPNVLQFLGMLVSRDGSIWLVTSFASNGFLHDYIDAHPEAHRTRWISQLADAVAYLHRHGIIHGSIKGSNIQISGDYTIRLGGFWVAKVDGEPTLSPLKGIGDLRWMAPELYYGDVSKTLTSDVYSFGITIYEILNGRGPLLHLQSAFEIVLGVMNNERPPTEPLTSRSGESYAPYWDVAVICWDGDPLKRPSMDIVCHRLGVPLPKIVDGPAQHLLAGKLQRTYSPAPQSSDADNLQSEPDLFWPFPDDYELWEKAEAPSACAVKEWWLVQSRGGTPRRPTALTASCFSGKKGLPGGIAIELTPEYKHSLEIFPPQDLNGVVPKNTPLWGDTDGLGSVLSRGIAGTPAGTSRRTLAGDGISAEARNLLHAAASSALGGGKDPEVPTESADDDNGIPILKSEVQHGDQLVVAEERVYRTFALSLEEKNFKLLDEEQAYMYGGYNDIFRASHETFGLVAVKRARVSDAKLWQLLRIEAKIWKTLNHRHILPLLAMIENGPQLYLVSPLFRKGTALKFVNDNPGANRRILVGQLASAISYLHSNDIVHGDIKGNNTLISDEEELVICDFGLSKSLADGMTTDSAMKGIGTLYWQAPELHGFQQSTASEEEQEFVPKKTFKTDVYAFGITISEILTGKQPFNRASSTHALIIAIGTKHKRPLMNPEASSSGESYAPLWQIASWCWDGDPEKRPNIIEICKLFEVPIIEKVEPTGVPTE